MKAGVDTVQFTEIESKQRKTLREKFGYSDTDTIVLHTGLWLKRETFGN